MSRQTRRPGPSPSRLVAYFWLAIFVPLVAGSVGTALFESRCDPGDPEVTECDLGAVHGLEAAVAGVALLVAVIVVVEVVLWLRRRASIAASTDRPID